MDRLPPPHVSPKAVWSTKLTFRIISSIFTICIIGIAAACLTTSYDSYYGYYSNSVPLIALGPPACVGIIWDVAEGICILARRGRRGIHPGAIVAIDLLLWLGFIVGVVFHAIFVVYDFEGYEMYTLSRAILAFGILEILIHITLFVFGCYETAIRNRSVAPIVVYPGGMPIGYGPPQPNPYGPPQPNPYAPLQPIMLPAGQAPPPGYVAYSYGPAQPGPTQPQPVHNIPGRQQQEHYAPKSMSPPSQELSPVHTSSTPSADYRNSHQLPS
ncbi:hypothetical protein ACO1O0_000963 [Amphichorda felina]